MNKKPFVLAICGPTASGKTWLGVELAKKYDGEIVSADSIQIYKGLDIASAKPSADEMQGVPHHLIDFLDRNTAFSVADYVQIANQIIIDVLNRKKLPIIVGGTGLYIDSLLDNVRFSDAKNDDDYRNSLYEFAQNYGNHALYLKLAELDPSAAEIIHENNLVRVVRALEVIHSTGRKFSELKAESRAVQSPYDSLIIGLCPRDRSALYDRINKRVDIMVQNGLVQEAKALWTENIKSQMKTSANAIGFKELIPYFENTASLDDCIDKIKLETRHYAKRQLTWFRRNKRIVWITIDDFNRKSEILQNAQCIIENYRQ